MLPNQCDLHSAPGPGKSAGDREEKDNAPVFRVQGESRDCSPRQGPHQAGCVLGGEGETETHAKCPGDTQREVTAQRFWKDFM